MNEQQQFDPSITDSHRVDRFATALELVASTTENHSRAFTRDTRRVFWAVVTFAAVSALASGGQQWRQNIAIERIEALSVEVREARDEARRAAGEASDAREEASDAREAAAAAPRIEIVPAEPAARGKPAKPAAIALVSPARTATPKTSGAPAAPAAPAVSVLIPAPSATVLVPPTTATGAGP